MIINPRGLLFQEELDHLLEISLTSFQGSQPSERVNLGFSIIDALAIHAYIIQVSSGSMFFYIRDF